MKSGWELEVGRMKSGGARGRKDEEWMRARARNDEKWMGARGRKDEEWRS